MLTMSAGRQEVLGTGLLGVTEPSAVPKPGNALEHSLRVSRARLDGAWSSLM